MDEHSDGSAATRRVWGHLPAAARPTLESGLAATDLQTLLIGVARARASAVSPPALLRRWRDDRFVQPAAVDPRRLAEVEARVWRAVPARFAGVELSPLAPLGTVSALGPVDQNRVVSTVRGTEVVGDPTNALALEAAARRRAAPGRRIDLAACHRVIRAQRFAPPNRAHFRLLALVSSARDRGSGQTEADLLIDHIGAWQAVLGGLLPGLETRVTFTVFGHAVLAERFADTIGPAVAGAAVPLVEEPGRSQGRGYYAGAAIGLRARAGGDEVDLGDGGLTNWTARLLGDAKERCLTSCLSTERLAALLS